MSSPEGKVCVCMCPTEVTLMSYVVYDAREVLSFTITFGFVNHRFQ